MIHNSFTIKLNDTDWITVMTESEQFMDCDDCIIIECKDYKDDTQVTMTIDKAEEVYKSLGDIIRAAKEAKA